jgi:hypothetical protein
MCYGKIVSIIKLQPKLEYQLTFPFDGASFEILDQKKESSNTFLLSNMQETRNTVEMKLTSEEISIYNLLSSIEKKIKLSESNPTQIDKKNIVDSMNRINQFTENLQKIKIKEFKNPIIEYILTKLEYINSRISHSTFSIQILISDLYNLLYKLNPEEIDFYTYYNINSGKTITAKQKSFNKQVYFAIIKGDVSNRVTLPHLKQEYTEGATFFTTSEN